MKTRYCRLFCASMTVLLAISVGCGSQKDPCSRAIDKMMQLGLKAATDVAATLGDETTVATKANEIRAKATAEMQTRRPDMLAKCREALQSDQPAAQQAIDCVLRANRMDELIKCSGGKLFR